MAVEVGVLGEEEVEGGGFGEAGEVGVGGAEDFDGGDLAAEEEAAPVGVDAAGDVGEDFDADAAVFQRDAGHHALDGFLAFRDGLGLQLRLLLGSEPVGDGDVPAIFVVEFLHSGSEELAVGGSVAPLVDQNLVVDHLVQENVLEFVFGEIVLRADADAEIVVFEPAEELPSLLVGAGAETADGAAQLERDGRQGAAEISVVKRFETFLQKGERRNHRVKNTNNSP